MFFIGMRAGGKSAGPLAIPGSVVTSVGLILLTQAVALEIAPASDPIRIMGLCLGPDLPNIGR